MRQSQSIVNLFMADAMLSQKVKHSIIARDVFVFPTDCIFYYDWQNHDVEITYSSPQITKSAKFHIGQCTGQWT